MTSQAEYKNPPIVEAIIDIKFAQNPSLTIDLLEGFHERVANDYPNIQDILHANGPIRPVGPPPEIRIAGFNFLNGDNSRLIQVRMDNLILNFTGKYCGWDQFYTTSHQIWSTFIESCGDQNVSQVSLRFINKISIPEASVDLKEYFNIYPESVLPLPQHLSDFFMHVSMQLDNPECSLNIVQMMDKLQSDQGLSFILDLSYVKSFDQKPSEDQLWDFVSGLRMAKNRIFQDSITAKTKDLFK